MVGEELERDDGDERRQELGARRHLDHVLGLGRDVPIARVGDGDHETVARPHLLEVAEHALVGTVAHDQRHHRKRVGDERDRAVLHLAAGVALGVDVGDLLELERALEGDRVLDAATQVEEVARVRELAGERLVRAQNVLYLGRGYNFPVALEGALKLKEISYIHAEGYAAGEMKHGPIALIDQQMPVVVIAPVGPTHEKMCANIEEVKARDGIVVALAEEGDREIEAKADVVIPVPAASYWIQPLLVAPPLQLFAYHLGVLRGCDVDQPRNLAKSVTVE